MDMATVLSYPLTPVPFTLCHITGAMNKTNKSVLMVKLEGKGDSNKERSLVDVYVIDAMFFLRTLPELPSTFGGIAKIILQTAWAFAKEVHIVCDTYPEGPSIKCFKREERGNYQAAYQITGPSQRRPTDFHRALLLASFKTALLRFLKEEWRSMYVPVMEGHEVYFGLEQSCYVYNTKNGLIQQREEDKLYSRHEEADTRVIYRVDFITKESPDYPTVVVRSCDTDVFVILLHHADTIGAKVDTGVSSKNTRRLINISQLATTLTPLICRALPAFHAFTGCDFTASVMRKAKARPYELMVKNERFLSTFALLGASETVDSKVSATIEEYVCCMYGLKNLADVNEARLHLFKTLYAPKRPENPMDKIKSADPCCLPPCKPVLVQKLKRTNYVANILRNANLAEPAPRPPNGYGWDIAEGKNCLKFVWFDGPQSPNNIDLGPLSDENQADSDEDDELLVNSTSSDEEEDCDDQ